MEVLIFKQDYQGASKGTKIFFQSGMWFYKTDTEAERWLDDEFVKSRSDLFGKWETNVWEFYYHVKTVG